MRVRIEIEVENEEKSTGVATYLEETLKQMKANPFFTIKRYEIKVLGKSDANTR